MADRHDADWSQRFDGGGSVDGSSHGRDGGTSGAADAAGQLDAGPSERGEFDFGAQPGAGFAGCFDGLDNDGDGLTDCEDASCRANVPACCVGVGEAVCCVPAPPEVLPLTSCRGVVTGCPALLEWAEPFGSPSSRVVEIVDDLTDEIVLVAGGQATDSGVVLRQVVDPRAEAILLEASIAGPARADALGANFIAFGLVDADHPIVPTVSPLSPTVAVLVSGNRAEVSLLVAGEIVQRWPLGGGFATYGLALHPGGRITLSRDGAVLGTADLVVDRLVRPVVYGRTYNPAPGDPPPVRLAALSLQRDRCDIPSALGVGEPVLPPVAPMDSGWSSVRRVAAPSVLRWTEGGTAQELMALEIDGAIHLARRGEGGWELTAELGSPALWGEGGWARDGLADPVLWREDGALALWVTGYAGGVGTVARVVAGEGESFAWSDVEVVFAPDADVRSFAQPAPYLREGRTHVVLRVERSSGAVALESHALGAPQIHSIRAPSADLFAFDRDEVASPVVVSTGRTWRLLFAGRRGTRWSIGMLVSPDGVTWVEPIDPLVRSASGVGFDALGARDPSLLVDGDTIELFYTGLDGSAAPRVGVVRGLAPLR